MISVLSRLFLGVAAPPYCANIPPYQCFRGCCTPLRMMACTPDLCSVIITKQLHTCKYTAIHYGIVMLAENRGWFETIALDFTSLHPPISKFWREHCV